MDNRVDGLDTQLLTSTNVDLNRDGVINAQDLQLLGGNYGFIGNSAPVITPVNQLTHVDLTTRIDLSKLAVDNEGDKIAFAVKAGTHGQVEISADGKYAIFTPDSGFGGTAGFELIASDGFSSSKASINVNVSTAALLTLDFVERNPLLQVGDKYQLHVVGDFADQKGVTLPDEYVSFGITSPVVTIDNKGLITASTDGTGVISVTRNGISAFTATRVGTFTPITANDHQIELAEANGLNVYPGAITLAPGLDRQLLVRYNQATFDTLPDLRSTATGTQYFVGNSNLISVDENGLLTAQGVGQTNLTVVYGGAELVVAVNIEAPHLGKTLIGTDGGAVSSVDGSTVLVAPGAFSKPTTIEIHSLQATDLTLAIPQGLKFVAGFKLDFDPTLIAEEPLQFAIPAPADVPVGSTVYFMLKGQIPDADGTWKPMWIQTDSGTVTADRKIRTQSPPWQGNARPGEYSIVYPDSIAGGANIIKGRVTMQYKMPDYLTNFLLGGSFSYNDPNSAYSITITIGDPNNSTIAFVTDGQTASIAFDWRQIASKLSQFNSFTQKIYAATQKVEEVYNFFNKLYDYIATSEQSPSALIDAQIEQVKQELDNYLDLIPANLDDLISSISGGNNGGTNSGNNGTGSAAPLSASLVAAPTQRTQITQAPTILPGELASFQQNLLTTPLASPAQVQNTLELAKARKIAQKIATSSRIDDLILRRQTAGPVLLRSKSKLALLNAKIAVWISQQDLLRQVVRLSPENSIKCSCRYILYSSSLWTFI